MIDAIVITITTWNRRLLTQLMLTCGQVPSVVEACTNDRIYGRSTVVNLYQQQLSVESVQDYQFQVISLTP